MDKARKVFYSNVVHENSGDQKKLFNATKRLLNRDCADDGFPPNLDSKAFASNIGKFFVQKIEKIRRRPDNGIDSHLIKSLHPLLLPRDLSHHC